MTAALTNSLIQRYYAAFNAQDWPGMLALLSPGVRHDINQGSTEHGLAAFEAFLLRMDRHYREEVHDLVILVNEDGQRAAAEFMIHGEYLHTDQGLPPATGQRYVLPVGAFFTLQGESISRVTNYYNLAAWTEQVSR